MLFELTPHVRKTVSHGKENADERDSTDEPRVHLPSM
jgi:hypothetical protein